MQRKRRSVITKKKMSKREGRRSGKGGTKRKRNSKKINEGKSRRGNIQKKERTERKRRKR